MTGRQEKEHCFTIHPVNYQSIAAREGDGVENEWTFGGHRLPHLGSTQPRIKKSLHQEAKEGSVADMVIH